MRTGRFIVASATALSLLVFANCQAEETGKQSAAARHSSKARDYVTRPDKQNPPDDVATPSTTTDGQKEGDRMPVLDSQVVDKAARDTGDNWKKMDKVLDRF